MQLRILTLNMWHGLDGRSSIKMGYLEPKSRRQKRLKASLEILKKSGAQILCLQEVNPAPQLTNQLATELNFNPIYTFDNTGVRIGSWGLPPPLFCGLSILVSPEFELNLAGAFQISGPKLSYASPLFCFRPSETRMCLFGLIKKSPWGNLLVGNYHLHHGVELTQKLKSNLNNLFKQKMISEIELQQLFDFCYAARDRRLKELDNLKIHLEQLCQSHGIENVLLAGDLNCTEESIEWKKILSWGFIDCHYKLHGAGTGFTWNSEINFENHQYDHHFHFPWPIDSIIKNPEKRQKIKEIFLENEFRKRRIDFLFCRGPISEALRRCHLFADEILEENIFISDHFGVYCDFIV